MVRIDERPPAAHPAAELLDADRADPAGRAPDRPNGERRRGGAAVARRPPRRAGGDSSIVADSASSVSGVRSRRSLDVGSSSASSGRLDRGAVAAP